MKEDKASSTAYSVVHGILHTAKNPQLSHLVDDDTTEACTMILSASTEGRKRLAQLNSPMGSKLLPFLEWLLLPGITLNYVLRKKFIEEKVLEAISDSTIQVINIGAGFDTLAWRLSRRFPSVTFIEIDHPATSIEKTKALSKTSFSSPNLFFAAADLSKTSLESVLENCSGFDAKRKTLYICEGVLMYLDEVHVIEIFDAIKGLTGSGSLFVFSCMEPGKSDKNNVRPLLHLYLKLKNERYRWYIPDTAIKHFVDERRYSFMEMANSETYLQNYLPKGYKKTLHQGEYIVMAKAR
ncbi:class I SAM-dependent methyltransferase [bacterium]|nr:class I SAM-dependent methyltransferase [bacterium]MBU1882725.1 class I SAM-dependent methyltransferase [bacterium]